MPTKESTPGYIKAVRTWYSNTEFKSKTEAIFARAMDLAGVWWEYEPVEWIHPTGWVPDFKLVGRFFSNKWKIRTWCVELKPSPPTQWYRNNLCHKFDDLNHRLVGVKEALIVGNPFDEDSPRTIEFRDSDLQWVTDDYIKDHTRIFGFWDEAKNYRFDLQH